MVANIGGSKTQYVHAIWQWNPLVSWKWISQAWDVYYDSSSHHQVQVCVCVLLTYYLLFHSFCSFLSNLCVELSLIRGIFVISVGQLLERATGFSMGHSRFPKTDCPLCWPGSRRSKCRMTELPLAFLYLERGD